MKLCRIVTKARHFRDSFSVSFSCPFSGHLSDYSDLSKNSRRKMLGLKNLKMRGAVGILAASALLLGGCAPRAAVAVVAVAVGVAAHPRTRRLDAHDARHCVYDLCRREGCRQDHRGDQARQRDHPRGEYDDELLQTAVRASFAKASSSSSSSSRWRHPCARDVGSARWGVCAEACRCE